MKVIHINKNDYIGGAAKACFRVHQELIHKKIDSKLYVAQKFTAESSVYGPKEGLESILYKISPYVDLIPNVLTNTNREKLISTAWCHTTIAEKVISESPDLINLHWICAGLMSIEDLKTLQNIPIVWTLHDIWPFSGGKHIPEEIDHNKDLKLDRWIFERKKKVYSKLKKLYVVTPSTYLRGLAKESNLLKGREIRVIPNGLNTKRFTPLNKIKIRSKLKLNKEKKYIMFGAEWATTDKNKGFDLLLQSLNFIQDKNIEGIVFGSNRPQNFSAPIPMHFFGRVEEDKLIDLYNAADVMVVPSRFESFGQTASEAQSCGLPVVAFNTSGLKDIVVHKKTGYLAKPFDTSDLSHGIRWVLKQNQVKISENCRTNAINRFDINKVAKAYISLYNEALNI